MDYQKQSRIVAINLMLKKMSYKEIDLAMYQYLTWHEIEQMTKNVRLAYNAFIE